MTINTIKFIFHVTYQCNLQCIYCSSNIPYINNNNKNKEIDYRNLILVIEHIKKNIPSNFNIQYYITGGEPSIYSNINKFINLLHKDNHKHEIYVRTNSYSKFDNIFRDINNVKFLITFHYDSFTDEMGRKIYFSNIIHNIQYLTKNNNFIYFNILSYKYLPSDIVNNILSQYKLVCGNNNIGHEIMIARQTNYYLSKENIVYNNTYYGNNILMYRSIKIKSDYNFMYACKLANKYIIIPQISDYTNLLHKKPWGIILSNLYKYEKCSIPNCDCRICKLDTYNN